MHPDYTCIASSNYYESSIQTDDIYFFFIYVIPYNLKNNKHLEIICNQLKDFFAHVNQS